MKIVLLTVAVFAVAMVIMAIGVILHRRCLRGSCGGPSVVSTDGESITCGSCGRTREMKIDSSDEQTG